MPNMGIKTNITLYTEGTPNGLKPTILLAELGLEYRVCITCLAAQVLRITT
jgi:glutathione S-transferase